MKKETLKEVGKFGLDLAKIVFAVAILPPLVKSGSVNWLGIIGALLAALGGMVMINKGADDE